MTPCTYFDRGAEPAWVCRVMAIGWLEANKTYPKGETPPEVVEKLQLLRKGFGSVFANLSYRGLHTCSLCSPVDSRPHHLIESHINIFVPTRGFVYATPGRVDHYIAEHGYAPPDSFVEALMACPHPSSKEFRALAAQANRGYEAPLFKTRF